MGWLSRGMNYQGNVPPIAPEQIKDGCLIADIDAMVLIIGNSCFQLLAHPFRRGRRAKKITAHVVINPDNMHSFGSEITDCFRSNQPRRAGNKRDAHACLLCTGAVAVDCARVSSASPALQLLLHL